MPSRQVRTRRRGVQASSKDTQESSVSAGSFECIEQKIRALGSQKDVGHAFEVLCRSFLLKAPQYRGLFCDIWMWQDWPEQWGPDKGIDLVAQTKDGKLWAIQAKADRPDRAIPKRELDSFLSESNRPDFAYRLIIATTDDIGRNARHTIEGQEKPVGLVLRGQLLSTQISWPTRLGGTFRPLPKRKPHPHQAKAVRDTLKGLRNHDRGQLIMACGTGKTLVALWIVEKSESRRTLVLVPSLSLITQTLSEWGHNSRKPFDYLVVCSDETVTHRGEDHAVMSTHDLGVPVTTESETIRRFVAKRSRDQAAVIFCTYQSSERIAVAQEGKSPRFDLVIADEAHRCAGHADSLFGTVLDSAKIKATKRLFMTATPRYFTGRVKRRAEELEYELASMDDEVAFGPVFHEFTFDAAIRADQLTDYQVAVIGVTGADIRRWVEEARLVRTRDGTQTDARTLATQIGVAKAMRRYDLRKVISFHTSVAKAKRFTDDISPESLPAVIGQMSASSRPSGQLWARHISGHTPAGRRATLLRTFGVLPKKTRGVISNCACLGEGVDVPALDGVAFVDPKRSMIDIIQAVGRVIRKAGDKKIGTVMIPVFIDDSEHADAVLSSSTFAPVWQVLRALRAHDNVLADQLDEIRLKLGKRPSSTAKVRLPAKIKFDVSTLLLKDFAQAFYVRTVEKTSGIPALTEEQILAWADEHNRVTGDYPTVSSGEVAGAPGETWAAIDACLKNGHRGLPGNSSLYELLAKHRGVRRSYGAPTLSEDEVWSWMKSRYERTGRWPNDKSGPVEDAPGETWAGIDLALQRGRRGMKRGSSLAKLRAKRTGIMTERQAAEMKRREILEYIKVHKKRPPHSHRLGSACYSFRRRDTEFYRLTDKLLGEVGGSTWGQRPSENRRKILAHIRRYGRPPKPGPLRRAFYRYWRSDPSFRAETDGLLKGAGPWSKPAKARIKREEIVEFIRKNRRLPSHRRKGEKQLGSACLRYRYRDKAFKEQTNTILEEMGVTVVPSLPELM